MLQGKTIAISNAGDKTSSQNAKSAINIKPTQPWPTTCIQWIKIKTDTSRQQNCDSSVCFCSVKKVKIHMLPSIITSSKRKKNIPELKVTSRNHCKTTETTLELQLCAKAMHLPSKPYDAVEAERTSAKRTAGNRGNRGKKRRAYWVSASETECWKCEQRRQNGVECL